MAVEVVDRDIGRERSVPSQLRSKKSEKERERKRERIAKVANIEG